MCTKTGVRNSAAVSRLSTAETTAINIEAHTNCEMCECERADERADERERPPEMPASRAPASSKSPVSEQTTPTSMRPPTKTKAGQSCEAADLPAWGSNKTAITKPTVASPKKR